ncbi:hypothetical protein ACKI2N_032740 [Cupriavidus sp. 30B13]|uniref:hypothetical protein n=1 Tax=Cupriavidus sp. 30B13 TaxID=3384241 RepID=UPI003B91CCE1
MSNLSDEERRGLVRERLAQWAHDLNEQATQWDLETVKHLVVLNAAGVAGAATLITNNSELKLGLAVALSIYVIGVILAVANLHLGALSFNEMSEGINERIDNEVDNVQVPITAKILRMPEKGMPRNTWAVRAGKASASAAILGTVVMICMLLIKSA